MDRLPTVEKTILKRMKTVRTAQTGEGNLNEAVTLSPGINLMNVDRNQLSEFMHAQQQHVDVECEMLKQWESYKTARDQCTDRIDEEFWKVHSKAFKYVFHVFVQVRGIPVGNAGLERLFALANAAIPLQRRSTSTETMRDLVVCKNGPLTLSSIGHACEVKKNAI